MWLEGIPDFWSGRVPTKSEHYEYTDIERKTGHSGISVQRYLSGFTKTVRFHSRGYSAPEIRELTDISERLVKEYLDLYETCKDRPEAQMRLQQILIDPPPSKKSSPLEEKSSGGMNS
jgi:hypothetical protein